MRQLLRGIVPIAFTVLIILFISFFAISIDYTHINNVQTSPVIILFSILVGLSFRYWGAITWRRILRGMGANNLPPFSKIAGIYARAWMGRYIPGKITWILARTYFSEQLGISRGKIASSALLESGIQLVALFTVSFLLIGLDPRLDNIAPEIRIGVLALAVMAVIAVQPPVFNTFILLLYRTLRRKSLSKDVIIDYRTIVLPTLYYAFGALLSGFSFYLLALGIYPEYTAGIALFCIGAYNLSGVIGTLTPALPSGLGIRDGALLALLVLVVPNDVALTLTATARIWSLMIDILFFSIARLTEVMFEKCN